MLNYIVNITIYLYFIKSFTICDILRCCRFFAGFSLAHHMLANHRRGQETSTSALWEEETTPVSSWSCPVRTLCVCVCVCVCACLVHVSALSACVPVCVSVLACVCVCA